MVAGSPFFACKTFSTAAEDVMVACVGSQSAGMPSPAFRAYIVGCRKGLHIPTRRRPVIIPLSDRTPRSGRRAARGPEP
jgi:hypothetical protein